MPQGKLQTVALVATLASTVIAGASDWNNQCEPKYEEYLCDDKDGNEVLTTYTLYPKGCAGYTQYPGVNDWEVWPTATTTSYDPWSAIETGKPYKSDPESWDEWETYPCQHGKNKYGKPCHDDDGQDWADWDAYPCQKGKTHDGKSCKNYVDDDEEDWDTYPCQKGYNKYGKVCHDDDGQDWADWDAYPCQKGKTHDGKSCKNYVDSDEHDDEWVSWDEYPCQKGYNKYGKPCKDDDGQDWADWDMYPCQKGKTHDGKDCKVYEGHYDEEAEDDWSVWPSECKYGYAKDGSKCRPQVDDKWCRDSMDRYGQSCKDENEWAAWKDGECRYGKDKSGAWCKDESDPWSNVVDKKNYGWHNQDCDYYGKDNKGDYHEDYDNKGCDYYGYDHEGKYYPEHDNYGYDCYGYDINGKYNKYYNKYIVEENWEVVSDDKHEFNYGYDYYGKKGDDYKKECDNQGKNYYGYDNDGKYYKDCDNNGYDHYGYHKDGHYSKYYVVVVVYENQWKPVDVVTVTITKTYSTPCPTGWEYVTKTYYHTPEYSTITTECPETWGVGKTVTYVVPVEPASTWAPYPAPAATSTWAPYPADASSTWVAITKAPEPSKVAEQKCDYVTKTYTTKECGKKENDGKPGYSTDEWEVCKDVVKTTSAYATTCTWAAWTSAKGAEAPAVSTWSPVAAWKGAAPVTGVSHVMIVVAGAVAGFAYML